MSLLPGTYTRHVVSPLSCCPPPLSCYPSLLTFYHCLKALLPQLFANSPDSIMWQLLGGLKYCQLPWSKAEWLSEPSQDYLELHVASQHDVQRLALQEKAAAERDLEGGVAFPKCLFKINHHCPGKHIKDLVWRCHSYRRSSLYITSIHYGPSCNVAFREDGSSRDLWTAGTLVLGHSQSILPRSYGMLSRPVSPWSKPIQCISSERSSLFLECVCKSKGFLAYPMRHCSMQAIISKW